MTKKQFRFTGIFLILMLLLTLLPASSPALDTSYELSRIRKARDLIDAHQYEAAYKILKSYDNYAIREIKFKALLRLADLKMRRDKANPYYDLRLGCNYMRRAVEYGKEPFQQWAYAEMLKKSPYLRMMPQVLAGEIYKWNLPAAKKGFALSQQELGMVLSEGAGPETDYVAAYMWLKLACNRYARAPDKDRPRAGRRMALAAAHMAVLERKHLSPDRIKEALKMARMWEKKHPGVYQVWPVEDQDY